MLFKEYPYNSKMEKQIIQEINKKNKLKSSGNKELDDLINKMLIIHVDERISWKIILNILFLILMKIK